MVAYLRPGLVVLVVLALFPPCAQGQDPAAPHPSPTANVLYAHHHDSDTEELNGWMNTHVTDPTGNDVALGPTTVPCCPEARTYTITLAPALTGPITLDPAGNIVINAYIGAGGSQGVVRVSTALTYGGETVVEGAAVNHIYEQAGTGPYELATWTLAPEITEFAAGEDLVWTLTLTGVAVQTVFLSVSAERGSSGITLPILSGGGGPAAPPAGTDTNSTTNSTTSTVSLSSSSSGTSTSRSSTTTSTSTSRSSSSANTTTTGNGTADEKDSPAPPLAFAALAVVVAAVAIRRRLR